MTKKRYAYEALQEKVRKLKTPEIDVWENKYKDKNYVVKIETSEFTCICPKSSLPDFGNIYIEYSPDKFCVELKSFKEYLIYFRNVGIFHEHLTNRVLDDFVKSCKPRWAKIRVGFNIRGGIGTIVESEHRKRS